MYFKEFLLRPMVDSCDEGCGESCELFWDVVMSVKMVMATILVELKSEV
jgi:hypothetical protein